MLLREITQSLNEKQIWGRRGKEVVRKFRCTAGRRKGRIVAKISQCFAAPNVKAKIRMKRTRAKLGAKMMRKRNKTMRTNPASIRVQALNKASRSTTKAPKRGMKPFKPKRVKSTRKK